MHYDIEIEGTNVKQASEALPFHQKMMEGGVLMLQDLETGFDLSPILIAKQQPDETIAAGVGFFKNVLFIQNQVRVPITFPARALTVEDIDTVSQMVVKLKTGQISSTGEVTLDYNKEAISRFLEEFKEDKKLQVRCEEQIEEILGTAILMSLVS